MPGGSFNYAYSHVQSFAEELGEKMAEFAHEDSAEVKDALNYIKAEAERIGKLMRAAEWYYSGDTGPESVIEAVTESKKVAA